MSLNQKYTWKDFLREYPEHKEKGTKRISPEGKKAFESAYKAYVKKYLALRIDKTDKETAKATSKRAELVRRSKEMRKGGRKIQMKIADKRIARIDASTARKQKLKERTKALQKDFK